MKEAQLPMTASVPHPLPQSPRPATPPVLRERVLREVLPRYEPLGDLAFAYLQGSLTSGYTTAADLDVVLVWDQPEVPTPRDAVVAALDERRPGRPFVVDYRDVHLERFWRAGQEYNVGHRPLAELREQVQAVLAGGGTEPEPGRILTPLVLVAGLCYGDLVLDREGRGAELRASLHPFPPALRERTLRTLRGRRDTHLADLRACAARADWLAFHHTLVAATRTALHALFAATGVYYPGDKWLRLALDRFGLDARVIGAYDRLWAPGAAPEARVEAFADLLRLADEP